MRNENEQDDGREMDAYGLDEDYPLLWRMTRELKYADEAVRAEVYAALRELWDSRRVRRVVPIRPGGSTMRHPTTFPGTDLVKGYNEMNAEQRLAFDAGFMWADVNDDWTRGPEGRSNTSEKYERLALAIASLLRNSSGTMFSGNWPINMGRLIMAQLAHKHGLAPTLKPAPSREQGGGGERRE